jgi:membrane-bound ClpP family serine protease
MILENIIKPALPIFFSAAGGIIRGGDAMEAFSFMNDLQAYQIIIFLVGLICLIIEMFMPNFGVVGGIGLVLLVVGILITAKTPLEAVIMFIILLAIVGIVLYVVLRSAAKGRLSKTLILNDSLNKEAGFIGTEDLEGFVGREGIASTVLRPSGTAIFDGLKLDVVSEGEFIPKGSKVKIVQVSGRRIAVKVIQ